MNDRDPDPDPYWDAMERRARRLRTFVRISFGLLIVAVLAVAATALILATTYQP